MAVRLTVGHAIAIKRLLFALKEDDALSEIRAVAQVVSGCKEHFAASGVATADIELYAEQTARPFLRDQRTEAEGR